MGAYTVVLHDSASIYKQIPELTDIFSIGIIISEDGKILTSAKKLNAIEKKAQTNTSKIAVIFNYPLTYNYNISTAKIAKRLNTTEMGIVILKLQDPSLSNFKHPVAPLGIFKPLKLTNEQEKNLEPLYLFTLSIVPFEVGVERTGMMYDNKLFSIVGHAIRSFDHKTRTSLGIFNLDLSHSEYPEAFIGSGIYEPYLQKVIGIVLDVTGKGIAKCCSIELLSKKLDIKMIEPSTSISEQTKTEKPLKKRTSNRKISKDLNIKNANKEKTEIGSGYGALNDSSKTIDQLNRNDYVRAFAELIRSKNTQPPLVIGIYGPWGSGKSTFLKLMEKEFEEKTNNISEYSNTIHTVMFNAWKYECKDQLWPGLIREISKTYDKKVFRGFKKWIHKQKLILKFKINNIYKYLFIVLLIASVALSLKLGINIFLTAAGFIILQIFINFKNIPFMLDIVTLLSRKLNQKKYGEDVSLMREIHQDMKIGLTP